MQCTVTRTRLLLPFPVVRSKVAENLRCLLMHSPYISIPAAELLLRIRRYLIHFLSDQMILKKLAGSLKDGMLMKHHLIFLYLLRKI